MRHGRLHRRGRAPEQHPGLFENLGGPRGRDRLEVHVGLGERKHSPPPERGQLPIDLPPDLAELGIARVAEREHGITQRFKSRRTAAVQEIKHLSGIVRRIAVALRTDDHQQQLLVPELASWVFVGGVEPRRQAGRPHPRDEIGGKMLGMSCLAAVKHRGGRGRQRGGRVIRTARLPRKVGEIARKPDQGVATEPLGRLLEKAGLAIVERRQAANVGYLGHGRGTKSAPAVAVKLRPFTSESSSIARAGITPGFASAGSVIVALAPISATSPYGPASNLL